MVDVNVKGNSSEEIVISTNVDDVRKDNGKKAFIVSKTIVSGELKDAEIFINLKVEMVDKTEANDSYLRIAFVSVAYYDCQAEN